MNSFWVEELYRGRIVIHNKKNEEWIKKKQSIATDTIELREDQFDLVTTSEKERHFKNYPILVNNKPYIFYDFDRSNYVLYKDQRLPMYNAGLYFREFQEREKRSKEILEKFQARAAVHKKKQK